MILGCLILKQITVKKKVSIKGNSSFFFFLHRYFFLHIPGKFCQFVLNLLGFFFGQWRKTKIFAGLRKLNTLEEENASWHFKHRFKFGEKKNVSSFFKEFHVSVPNFKNTKKIQF